MYTYNNQEFQRPKVVFMTIEILLASRPHMLGQPEMSHISVFINRLLGQLLPSDARVLFQNYDCGVGVLQHCAFSTSWVKVMEHCASACSTYGVQVMEH